MTFLDKLYFGSSVCKMNQLCSVVLVSKETAGTGQKYTKEAGVGIMRISPLMQIKSYHMPSTSTQGRGAQFVQSRSEILPWKVYLISLFFPTDRCGEVRGKQCLGVTAITAKAVGGQL